MICSTFFGDPDDPSSDDSFSFEAGGIWVSPYDFQEIDSKTWDSLTILNNLNLQHEVIA
jgi:hypothetical protein